jgi:hypothetical protein
MICASFSVRQFLEKKTMETVFSIFPGSYNSTVGEDFKTWRDEGREPKIDRNEIRLLIPTTRSDVCLRVRARKELPLINKECDSDSLARWNFPSRSVIMWDCGASTNECCNKHLFMRQ